MRPQGPPVASLLRERSSGGLPLRGRPLTVLSAAPGRSSPGSNPRADYCVRRIPIRVLYEYDRLLVSDAKPSSNSALGGVLRESPGDRPCAGHVPNRVLEFAVDGATSGSVGVPAVVDVEHADCVACIVDLVADAVLPAPRAPLTLERPTQRGTDSTRLPGQRPGDEPPGRECCGLRQDVGQGPSGTRCEEKLVRRLVVGLSHDACGPSGRPSPHPSSPCPQRGRPAPDAHAP